MESVSLSCDELKSISNATSIHINSTIFKITNIDEVKQNIRHSNLKKLCQYSKFNILEQEENFVEDFKVNMSINLTRMSIGHTELMKNDIYYNIYCIGINAIFSSLLPFFALMFFNVRIALKLRNKQPNFLITYLLRGRQRSTSRGCSPQEGVEGEEGVPLDPLPWHRQSLTLFRQLEGHRLCVRFTKKEEASSSSKPNSLAREENNAIEIIPKESFEDIPNNVLQKNVEGHDSNESLNHIQVRRVSSGSIRLRRSNSPVCRRRESRLTRISLTIVWLFLFCHIWKLIPTAFEVFYARDQTFPTWMHYIKHTSHALIVLNSSLNFLIYVII